MLVQNYVIEALNGFHVGAPNFDPGTCRWPPSIGPADESNHDAVAEMNLTNPCYDMPAAENAARCMNARNAKATLLC